MTITSYRRHCWLRLRFHKWESLYLFFAAPTQRQRCLSCGATRIR